MDETWLTVEQLIGLGVSEPTVYRRTKGGEWESRVGRPTPGRGRPAKEVRLLSLPAEIQARWAAAEAIERGDGEETEETEDLEPGDGGDGAEDRLAKLTRLLARIPMEERDNWINELTRLVREVLEPYASISPKRAPDRAGELVFVPGVLALCERAKCTDAVVLRQEPHRAKAPSARTLDRWARQYKRGGFAALLREPVKTGAQTDKRRAELHAGLAGWLRKVWTNYPSPKALREEALLQAKKEGWGDVPSEAWFYRQRASLPEAVRVWHFEGAKAFTDRFEMYVPRDYSDLDALQVLCGDHSQRDVSVVLKDGSLARPWLTLWQCLRTGLLWGWWLDLVPSSYTIGRAYHNGVTTFGAQPFSRPDEGYYSYLYTDQGRDYKSRHLDGKITVHKLAGRLDGRMEMIRVERRVGLLAEMDVKRLLARGYNAREKMVERTHRDISEGEKNAFWKRGYRGPGTESVPEQWREMYKLHQKFEKGKRSESPFPSIQEYKQWLGEWIAKYNSSGHERSTLGGRTVVPLEEYKRLYTTRYEIEEESLSLLLLKSESQSITKLGVRVTGTPANWFYYHPAMFPFKGARVEVLYDEANYSRVRALLPDGALVVAEAKLPASVLNPDKAMMKEIAQEKAKERNAAKDWEYLRSARLRGETAEDRVAAAHEEEYELEENEAIAVGEDQRSVRRLTRMDRAKKLAPVGRVKPVTVAEVAAAKVDESIFQSEPRKTGLKDEWE